MSLNKRVRFRIHPISSRLTSRLFPPRLPSPCSTPPALSTTLRMDADSFSAFAHNEPQQHLYAGGQRSHGMTLSNSHSASSNRAQQPLPLVLPQLQHLPLSTPLTAPASTPTPSVLYGQHQQQQQIQIPPASESQIPDTSNSNSNAQQQAQSQVQAQMEAGVLPTAEDKARYEAARKELIQALQKKRAVDRTLVSFSPRHCFCLRIARACYLVW